MHTLSARATALFVISYRNPYRAASRFRLSAKQQEPETTRIDESNGER